MEKEIDKLVEKYKSDIYDDFRKIVDINSFSSNLEGIKECAKALVEVASQKGIALEETYSSKRRRPHLMYSKSLESDFYAFIGHFDTVHPPESEFDKMVDEGDILRGPGTNDMKGGLIVALYSLVILKELYPDRKIPIKILFNSDEEIGSPDSSEIIKSEFKNAKAGFVFEAGRAPGYSVVTSRKGVFEIIVEIEGKAAHSGVEPWNGINAIVAAAKIVQRLDGLNDYDKGIIVGCNQIVGGIAKNVVPPDCKIDVNVRFVDNEQERYILSQMEEIFSKDDYDGAKVSYRLIHSRPPLVKTTKSQELYELYRSVSNFYGFECSEVSTGGGSDANYLGDLGVPVIDGVGVVGKYSHTTKEYILKSSIIERIKIFVLFMTKLTEKD